MMTGAQAKAFELTEFLNAEAADLTLAEISEIQEEIDRLHEENSRYRGELLERGIVV